MASALVNSFFEPGTDHCVSVTQACAMDLTLCRELLEFASRTAEILQQDADLGRRCREAAKRVRPLRIGSKGQLLEWDKEFPFKLEHFITPFVGNQHRTL